MKSFLSHSSQNKNYVEITARHLGPDKCVYDAFTFEEGMKTFDEIISNLSKSDLFVLFLSNEALESEWVTKEVNIADELLTDGIIKKVFPIIVDPSITHEDPRIPTWLTREYNIRYISKPTIAARRIRQRMIELSWDVHPQLKEKNNIFVGRNDLNSTFEVRIDDFHKPTPFCVIASGIKGVGRRRFLKYAFTKANLIKDSYDLPIIMRDSKDGIEDFILKIDDLGFTEKLPDVDYMKTSINVKIDMVAEMIRKLHHTKERILVIDNGCIITADRDIADWFKLLVNKISDLKYTLLSIVSNFRCRKDKIRPIDNVFYLEVPELDFKEREGLLKRYAEFEELGLSTEDLLYFSKLLNGFPEQVFFTVHLIKDIGLAKAKSETYQIVEYNSVKIRNLFEKYIEDEKAMDLLRLLSEFDFISYDLVVDLIDGDVGLINLLNTFSSNAICEFVGSNSEYIRLNDAVRDYINRSKRVLPQVFKDKIKAHVSGFLKTYLTEEKDLSDYLFSLKEALLSGQDIDDRHLIPSHFLKSMKELYDQHKRYDDVIRLADRVLQNESNIDNNLTRSIRYYLCLSLARKKADRFLTEVQKISGPDHKFLLGFYYRLTGRYSESIVKLEAALGENPNHNRARRELVQVYIFLNEYQTALELAKRNYEEYKTNPFHIQAYFNCLLRTSRPFENSPLLLQLISNLEKVQTDLAIEMSLRAHAEYLAFNKNDENAAIEKINEAIGTHTSEDYALFSKFEICERFSNLPGMESVILELESRIDSSSYFYSHLKRNKCICYAYTKGKDYAIKYIAKELRNFPATSKEKLLTKIDQITH